MEIIISVCEAKGLTLKYPNNSCNDHFYLIGVADDVSGEFFDSSKCVRAKVVQIPSLLLLIRYFSTFN
jgi:hypothetical protein